LIELGLTKQGKSKKLKGIHKEERRKKKEERKKRFKAPDSHATLFGVTRFRECDRFSTFW
jgi:hypothetical protein